MHAALCRDHGQPLALEEVILRPPGPGEVQVALEAVAICHSDLGYLDGLWSSRLPAVYGHEAAGRITALGAGVGGLRPGDAVVVTMLRACGQCRPCRTGKPFLCAAGHDRCDGRLSLADGTVVEQGLSTAAFAQSCVVHASQVARVPEDLPMELGALLACGVITGTGAAIHTAQVRPGEAVVVIGAGGVGLNVVQGARIAGAGRIIAIDIEDAKLAAALEFGATDALRADRKGLRRAVLDLTEGQGADHVLVAVGALAAYAQAASLACRGGQVVAVGMPPSGAKVEVEPVILAATGQALRGSFMGSSVVQRDIPALVALWRQGRLKLEALITARHAFADINLAIAEARRPDVRRIVLHW